LGRPSSEFT